MCSTAPTPLPRYSLVGCAAPALLYERAHTPNNYVHTGTNTKPGLAGATAVKAEGMYLCVKIEIES